MDNSNAIEVISVSKQFWDGDVYVSVLKEVNLTAYRGQILLITGPSGSGKSTLLSIMAGTLKADSGIVNIFGTDINALNNEEVTSFRRKNVGFILQHFHLIKTLNIQQNVSVPLLLNGYSEDEALARAKEALRKVGMEKKIEQKPSYLSGGEQQRVAIARALVHNPWLVFCDEPTASLDATNGTKVMEAFKQIVKDENQTVVIVTHDNRIFKYGDAIVRLEDGIVTS